MTKFIYALFIATVFIACKEQTKTIDKEPIVETLDEVIAFEEKALVIQTVDYNRAQEVGKYVRETLLDNKFEGLRSSDRQFQIYKADLNSDRVDETFVRLLGTPFCSSDGCTFLLLDRNNKQIAKFNVISPSIYVSSISESNGWKDLMVESGGKFRYLKFNNDTYPNNPSMEEATDNYPNGDDVIIFDEGLPSKVYTF